MAMTDYFNCGAAKDKRRVLRQAETAPETLLWVRLRGWRVSGLKFRRQYSVGVYILDFYCPACHLAIELDGESHNSLKAQEYDAERTEFLSTLNIHILRFANAEVYKDIKKVISTILTATQSYTLAFLKEWVGEERDGVRFSGLRF